MKKHFQKTLKSGALILPLTLFFLFGNLVYAQSFDFNKDSGLDSSANTAGFVTGSDAATVNSITGQAIAIVLGMVGVVFLGFLIYGGFVWMIADGNQEKVKAATKTIMNSLLGIILTLSAYALSYFLIKYFR